MQIINPTSGGLYTGISNAVSTIYRLEGLRTLWRGVSSVIVGAGMDHARNTILEETKLIPTLQVPLMPSISGRTRSSKNLLVVTLTMANTTLWRRVCLAFRTERQHR